MISPPDCVESGIGMEVDESFFSPFSKKLNFFSEQIISNSADFFSPKFCKIP